MTTNENERLTWVIIPVHNRRDITLRCLNHLKETQDWGNFDVLVVDDGSTDGTSDAIVERFPNVTVLQGDGSLWWGGSIRKGMKYANNQNAEVFIWLNDDVLPEPGSITKLANKAKELGDTVLSTKVEMETGKGYTTCNKKTRFGIRNIPYDTTQEIQYCDAAAGKFTAFPRGVVDAIGFPDNVRFPHNFCDWDYTFRAKKNGFKVGVYTEISACDTGQDLKSARLSPDISFEQLAKNYFHPSHHEGYNIKNRYRKYRRFFGPPEIISYLTFAGYLIGSLGILLTKLLLVLLKGDQRLREY